jgi:hypothetical protein
MNQRWRQIVLWLIPIGIAVFLGFQFLGAGSGGLAPGSPISTPRNAATARMSYGRFLDYVEAGRVTRLTSSMVAAWPWLKRSIPISTIGSSACGLTCPAWLPN